MAQIRLLMVFLFTAFIITGCTKQSQFIETVELTNNLYIVQTDTIVPEYTVYMVDSFQTSDMGRTFVGRAYDPLFGSVRSEGYAQFSLATNYYETVGSLSESYDSIRLIMKSDKNYYGDTLNNTAFEIFELRQAIDGDNKVYYNQNTILYQTQPIGSFLGMFRPNTDDSLSVVLSDEFGSDLFNMYKNRHTSIQTEQAFLQYFRGLAIVPTEQAAVLHSFGTGDSTMYIRLYYHDDQGTPVKKFIDFKSKGGRFQFNRITYDPSGTPLEVLRPGDEVSSRQLKNRIYQNDLAGVGTKIRFPSITQLPLIQNYIGIADANLIIRPMQGSFVEYPLVPYMSLGLSMENSTALSPLFEQDGETVQLGNLYVDPLDTKLSSYSYDLTQLLTSEITATIFTTKTVYLQPYNETSGRVFSTRRIVAADNENVVNPSQLNCRLLFYKTDEQ